MIPRLKPDLDLAELRAAARRPGQDDVATFEGAFAAEMGQRHAIAFPYGRTGLLFLLEAMGLHDQEIICPAYTCVVVAHAVVLSGNRPVFVDCAPAGYNMDLDAAEALIGPDTGAIIATSLFGYPVDLDRLDAIRQRHPGVKIIQDCAHSFAAEWRGRPVQQAGDAAIFGLNVSKLITSIFGGMVTTDDEALAQRLRAARDLRLRRPSAAKSLRRAAYLAAVYPAFEVHAYRGVKALQEAHLLDRFVSYYDESRIDMPADYLEPMTDLEARVGMVQIVKYRQIVERRRRRAAAWRRALAGTVDLPPEVPGATYSHFVVQVPERAAFLAAWRARGIELGILIEYCIPDMAAYRRYARGEYPQARSYAAHSVNFPLGPDVDEFLSTFVAG